MLLLVECWLVTFSHAKKSLREAINWMHCFLHLWENIANKELYLNRLVFYKYNKYLLSFGLAKFKYSHKLIAIGCASSKSYQSFPFPRSVNFPWRVNTILSLTILGCFELLFMYSCMYYRTCIPLFFLINVFVLKTKCCLGLLHVFSMWEG